MYANNIVTPRSTVVVPNRQSIQIQQRPNFVPQIYTPQVQQRQVVQQPQVQAFVKPQLVSQPVVQQTIQQIQQPIAQQVVSQQVIQAPPVQQIVQIPQAVSPSSQILVNNNTRVNNTIAVNS